MNIYTDILEHLFYEVRFDLGVGMPHLFDYVNNLSPFVLTVIGIHLGIKILRECIFNP